MHIMLEDMAMRGAVNTHVNLRKVLQEINKGLRLISITQSSPVVSNLLTEDGNRGERNTPDMGK